MLWILALPILAIGAENSTQPIEVPKPPRTSHKAPPDPTKLPTKLDDGLDKLRKDFLDHAAADFGEEIQ